MKWNKQFLKKGGKFLLVLCFMVVAIAFTRKESDSDICQEVVINIRNQTENYYLDENDINRLITNNGTELITGMPFSELNLKTMEDKVKEEAFADNVEVYKDLKGNLIVNVDLKRPMARIIRQGAPHAYIAEDGTIMPVSERFTSRVILVSGSYASRLIAGDEDDQEDILKLISFIREVYQDDFWRSQFSQLDIDEQMNITILPQVTKQKIEFGKPENIEQKFSKLMISTRRFCPARAGMLMSV